jgi:oxygen-dependent protoporphyrinogen oxidase
MMRTSVIIGGGIGGLACAHRLLRHAAATGEPERITVLEAGERWGGVIASEERDGFLCERGPDAVLTAKPAAIELMRELGLEERIIQVLPAARRTLIARGARLLPVPDGLYLLAPGKLWPFVTSAAISWPGKLRMLLDLVKPRRAAGVTEESLAGFVRRRLGREALDRLAQPLVGGIYSADPEELSVDAAMPQFVAMEREHRSLIVAIAKRARTTAAAGPRYGMFASLKGGLGELVATLIARLGDADLRLRSPVAGIERVAERWRVTLDRGEVCDADRLVIAGPAHVAAGLLAPIDAQLAEVLAAIPYRSIITVNAAFKNLALPESAGFVVPAVEHRSISACTFASRKFAGRAPDGAALLRAAVGTNSTQDSDEDVLRRTMTDLDTWLGCGLLPDFNLITHHRRALAQPVLGHAARVERIRKREKSWPGLALIGNGYEGSGIPDIIDQANAAARRPSWRQAFQLAHA